MDRGQQLQQIRYMLRKARWSDTSAIVFGSIVITSRMQQDASMAGLALPIVLIRARGGSADPDEPDLMRRNYSVTLIVSGQNDALGESSMLGAAHSGGAAGRGLTEIERHINAQVARLQGDLGIRHYIAGEGEGDSEMDPDLGYVAFCNYPLVAQGTAAPFYHPARNFSVSGSTLSWALPPDRFDRLRMVLRYLPGATAPSSPTSGTGITLASDLATSATGIAGTNSYALFAAYDDYPVTSGGPAWIADGTPTTERSYSSAVTLTATI